MFAIAVPLHSTTYYALKNLSLISKGSIMANWKCKVCGYTHQGADAPETCPKCGAPKSQFREKCRRRGCNPYTLLLIAILTALVLCYMSCSTAPVVDNSTVKSLDLNRFMGRWYEIARLDHDFERDMQQVITMYTIEDNGRVKVVNQGFKGDRWKTAEGKGKLTNTPGLLRVSFWGPFYSDYRVMMLAADYSYALIGGGSGNYLWLLSRTPQIRPEIRDVLLREAQRRGYNTDNLIWVEQKANQ